MKYKILSIISTILVAVGLAVSSSASFFIWYQPKTPKTFK
jgi:cyclic lactone autoinducer peptide